MQSKNLNNKLYQYFKQKLGSYDYTKGWIKSDCPNPACGKHVFGIHLGINRSNCFSCGFNKRPLDIVMEIEGTKTFRDTMIILNSLEGIEYREPLMEPYKLKTKTLLPHGYRGIKRGESVIAKSARNYLIKRGFSIDELAKASWGYCTKGKYLGYVIMPFYMGNKLIYFNARKFLGTGPKFNNPDLDDFGLGKSMIIYNIDTLFRHDRVFIFESVINAATMGDAAIAMGGKKLSNYQLNTMIKSPVKKFIIGLDDDALSESIKLGLQLVDYKQVKIMQFPLKKDVNDLGKKKCMKIIRQSNWLDRKGLLSLKHIHEKT